MTATIEREITNKDLLDFMGTMAEDITDIRSTMATKDDLKSLREEIMEELGELRTQIQKLSEREDRDTQVTLGLIADLQKRVTYLEDELEDLKAR